MISFKQRHFEKEMILMLVRWYVAYSLSYRDVEEFALERLFLLGGVYCQITIRQIKYLNNIIEQEHRFIKKIINSMRGFKTFATEPKLLLSSRNILHKSINIWRIP